MAEQRWLVTSILFHGWPPEEVMTTATDRVYDTVAEVLKEFDVKMDFHLDSVMAMVPDSAEGG